MGYFYVRFSFGLGILYFVLRFLRCHFFEMPSGNLLNKNSGAEWLKSDRLDLLAWCAISRLMPGCHESQGWLGWGVKEKGNIVKYHESGVRSEVTNNPTQQRMYKFPPALF